MPPFTRSQPAETATADLPDWRRDPRLAELTKKRDAADVATRKLTAAVGAAEGKLDRLESAVEPAEIAVMAGQGDAKMLERAQKAATEARGELADARQKATDSAEESRKLGVALSIVTDEAKVAARLAFGAPYRAALARLDALLLEASAASEAVYRIWRAADAMFVGEVSPRGVRHPDCGGLIRGNWPELALPGDLAMDGRPESRFSRWHQDIEEGTFIIDYGTPTPTPPAAAPKPPEPPSRRFIPDISKEPATPQVRFTPNVDADDAEEARLGLGWNGGPG